MRLVVRSHFHRVEATAVVVGFRRRCRIVASPTLETIDRFDDELASLENEKRELDRQSKVCQREVGELNEKLEALRLEFDLPTEADLQSVRQRREQGWQLIRAALLGGDPASEAVQEFSAAVGEGDDLATAFEHSIKASDQIADRLRREAVRVATRAERLGAANGMLEANYITYIKAKIRRRPTLIESSRMDTSNMAAHL